MEDLIARSENILVALAYTGGAIIAGLLIHFIFFLVFERVIKHTPTPIDDYIIRHTKRPSRYILPLVIIYFLVPFIGLSPAALETTRHVLSLFLIASFAWLVVQVIFILEDVVMSRYDLSDKDNLKARKVLTQIQVFKRVVTMVISILALAAMLMTFEQVRQLGASILASAGVVGLVIGFAAQRTIATVFAGFQIAITQPIRIDDVVIVEGEWGRIEEITLTYVIVRIWANRRLIVPITNFIDKPFQNWTRSTADLLGTVSIYTDYTVPVDEVRNELQKIVEGADQWDGKVANIQITDSGEKTMKVRALVSAEDSGKLWGLRCLVREKLIEFIQKNYPDSLPKVRAEMYEPPKDKK